ncbi:hypothetical protein [Prevotella sp. tc2-28]|uniref:hypothetical protein n=1 Tax=Prevotella sp. tc2-28 TaxID=1761888 RepID=UPI00115FEF58|nr:hypothetical protein [Prevotella sp. tc2-28]
MKKYFLTMTIMVIFAIGFAASDESNSSSSTNGDIFNPFTQTKQEQEVLKHETEEEKVDEKQEKIKKIANIAYNKGWNRRMKSREFPDPRGEAHMEYTMRYGVEPTEPGEEERWNIFVDNYVKGYNDAWEKIRKDMHSDDL